MDKPLPKRPDSSKDAVPEAIAIAAVSRHAAREKSIRHGHPSTLHLWWARGHWPRRGWWGDGQSEAQLKEDIDFYTFIVFL